MNNNQLLASKLTLKSFIYEMIEDYLIASYNSKKLDLISDVVLCTKSSFELIKKMTSHQLQSILNDCNSVKNLHLEHLQSIGFSAKVDDSYSMVKLKYSNNYVFVNKLDPFGQSLSLYGGHEFMTLKVLNTMVREGDTYIELGANYGDFLLTISETVGVKGKVYGFEPSTTIFKFLRASASISKQQNVLLENKAVSDKNKIEPFDITDSMDGYSSLGSAFHSESHQYSGAKTVYIESVSLDNYFKKNYIIPNLIRLDIEGSECKALRGLQETIEQYKPNLSIEFQSILLERFEDINTVELCLDILYNNNYKVRDLYSLQSISKENIITAYSSLQDTELLCTYNSEDLIENLQKGLYINGWAYDIQTTGDLW